MGMHKLKSVLVDELKFDIQTDHLISDRIPHLVLMNKKKKKKERGFCCAGVRIKEIKNIDKYSKLAWELKKLEEPERESDMNCNWCIWNDSQGFWTGGIGNQRKNRDH